MLPAKAICPVPARRWYRRLVRSDPEQENAAASLHAARHKHTPPGSTRHRHTVRQKQYTARQYTRQAALRQAEAHTARHYTARTHGKAEAAHRQAVHAASITQRATGNKQLRTGAEWSLQR